MNSSPPKKILYVITKSNWGGAQKYVYTLANACKKNGDTVLVCFGDDGKSGTPGLLAEKLTHENIRTIFVPSLTRALSLGGDIRAYRALCHIFRDERPDVVHLNSSKVGILGALAARHCHVKHSIFTAHGFPFREARSLVSKIAFYLASWITIQYVHCVIAVSEMDKKQAPAFPSRKKVVLIHNGIDKINFIEHDSARQQLLSYTKDTTSNKPLMVSIGELTKNKGYDVMLEALSEVKKTQEFLYIVFGEGEEREHLMQSVRDRELEKNVIFAGFFAGAPQLLAGADLFILPSRKEGFPFVLLEAGLAKQAVIATKTGGIPEIITNDTSGLLVKKNDSAALAHAIITLLEDSDTRRALGNELYKIVSTRFTEEEMITKTFALYEH